MIKNGYGGLLHVGTLNNSTTVMSGDILHANDVEPFPTQLEAGFFGPGDVIVSLRNINTIFVFNQDTEEIKHLSAGQFVRQHDPDFIDGNSYSVFDNNNVAPGSTGVQSRIITLSGIDSKMITVDFEGSQEKPFFTSLGGKHQWLPNGNLLITETTKGRGFEVTPQGEIVWQYINYVDQDIIGLLSEVQRLPIEYKKLFSKSP